MKKEPGRAMVLFILGAFDTITPLTIDMYLPAFGKMAADFGTTEARVSLSLTSYFVGFGVGQIIYGPLLDRYGRQRPLTAGMIVYILACIACALSRSIEMLVAFRFIQALGACVAAVGVRAMVRDFFTVEESPTIYSVLMLILAVSPLLAPSLGSLITSRFDWPWVFIILASVVVVVLILMYLFLPERHPPDPGVSLAPGPIIRDFLSIVRNRQFLVYTAATSFTFGGLFIYLAGSTVILLGEFHVTPSAYALLFALQSIGLVAGNQLNIMLLKNTPSERIFITAIAVQMISSLGFLIGSYFGLLNVAIVITVFFIQLGCLGMTFPNGSALALAPFTTNLGRASALMGFLQTSVAGIVSGAVGFFNAANSLPIALMLFASSLIAFAVGTMTKRIEHHSAT